MDAANRHAASRRRPRHHRRGQARRVPRARGDSGRARSAGRHARIEDGRRRGLRDQDHPRFHATFWRGSTRTDPRLRPKFVRPADRRGKVLREEASLSLDSLLLRPGQMHLALSSEHVTVKISYPLSPTGSHVEVSNGCLHARSDTVPVELGI